MRSITTHGNRIAVSILIVLSLLMPYICFGENITQNDTATASPEMSFDIPFIDEAGTVVLLATGGTIVGQGEEGKETGYKSGSITGEALVESVPGLSDIANIEVIQVCNLNSDDITSREWIALANTINVLAANENVAGFVITHGTDTMEETAYFLNLTVKTDKPVILTGSMRPATALSADGPLNLYQAVCLARSEEAKGQGVLAVFADNIYSARTMMKTSTYSITAISAGETGCVGIMRNDTPYLYETTTKRHTLNSEFDIKGWHTLPKVSIVYFNVDADAELLKEIAKRSDGIVIAGAGAGEFSKDFIAAIDSMDIPVVISSRIDDGIITQDAVLCPNTIAANNLPPQKAAILLRLALATGIADFDNLIRIYSEY